MLRYRVIPLVLLDGYSVVKTIKFDVRRNLGNPITVARVYNLRNVDELILLDIDAAKENREIDLHTVRAVAEQCFMPLTVGGGLKTCQDISKVLQAGADKVSLNSVFFENRDVLKEAVSVFGSQCIIASVDIKKDEENRYTLFSHSGKIIGFSLEEGLELLVKYNVGEILVNNVDLDGMMCGYDFDLISFISSFVKRIPIIVAGGASNPYDCSKAVKCGASAVAAASIFHFTSITPRICKEAMRQEGIPVRL